MSVPCVTQARIFSSRRRSPNKTNEIAVAVSSSWSLPVWIIPMESASPLEGMDNPAVLLHSRVATPLGIEHEDDVVFELVECGERFKRQVTVSSDLMADFIIHDALSTEICIKAGVARKTTKGITTTTTTLQLRNHITLELPGQDLWTDNKTTNNMTRGHGILHFDGASRPKGPAGFGFSISSASAASEENSATVIVGPDLVNGYCYCGSGTVLEMQYAALLEACIWAVRFRFEKLWIRSDATLVISQVSGQEEVSEDSLVEYFYYTKIQALLEQANDEGTEIDLEQVPKEANVICNVLASLALDLKENATACNWDNINQQCRRPKK